MVSENRQFRTAALRIHRRRRAIGRQPRVLHQQRLNEIPPQQYDLGLLSDDLGLLTTRRTEGEPGPSGRRFRGSGGMPPESSEFIAHRHAANCCHA